VSSPLQLRDLIPPVSARTPDGKAVHAWDYKQKRNLVIAFLHADCAACALWLAQFTGRAADFAEYESTGLILYSEAPSPRVDGLPAPFVVAIDAAGHSQRAFMGKDAFGPSGLDRVGIFVTDRYGELRAQWIAREATELPVPDEVLKPLRQIQMAC
jgi:hypothetical protein